MTMQIKAIIWRKDLTNDVVRIKRKKVQDGGVIVHKGNIYQIDSQRARITSERRFTTLKLLPTYYSTYYYIEGHAYPVPTDGKEWLIQKITVQPGPNGSTPEIPEVVFKEGGPDIRDGFKILFDQRVSPEKLRALFTPWFYRTIAPTSRTIWDEIQFYLTLGIALGVAYIAWGLMTGKFKVVALAAGG